MLGVLATARSWANVKERLTPIKLINHAFKSWPMAAPPRLAQCPGSASFSLGRAFQALHRLTPCHPYTHSLTSCRSHAPSGWRPVLGSAFRCPSPHPTPSCSAISRPSSPESEASRPGRRLREEENCLIEHLVSALPDGTGKRTCSVPDEDDEGA